jgi:hypothetical protein
VAQIYGSKNAQSLAIIWLYTQAAKHYHKCILMGNLTAQNTKIDIKYKNPLAMAVLAEFAAN